ncbi:tetratricopeptide repeat protein [bacterium]|nr:tetratricopeptide repeat protein [bacterium]
MRKGIWILLLFVLALLINHSLSSYPPSRWRDFILLRYYLFNAEKKKAEKKINEVLEKNADNPKIILATAQLLALNGDIEKAEEFLRRAAEKFPNDEIYYFLGQFLYLQGKMDEAEKSWEKALQLNPSNPFVLNDLGYLWVEKNKKLDEAIEMLEKAAKMVRSPEILDSLGWAYLKYGKMKEGLQLLKKAVQGNPYSWEIRYHLAIAYKQVGDEASAKVELKKAEILSQRGKIKRGGEWL